MECRILRESLKLPFFPCCMTVLGQNKQKAVTMLSWHILAGFWTTVEEKFDVERLVYISNVMPCGGEGQMLNGSFLGLSLNQL